MFEFNKKKQLHLVDILEKEVPDNLYLKKEVINRFVPKETKGLIHFVGAIYPNPNNEQTTLEQGGRVHDSHKVIGIDRVCKTLCARDWKEPIKILCPPKGEAITYINEQPYSIRVLSPKEYWRLQGIPDSCFEKANKVIPASKMYERAGRAICIPMLESIFKKSIKPLENGKELRLFESFSGIGSQRIALDLLNIPYTSVGISEVDRYAILAYDAIHNSFNKEDPSEGKTDEEMLQYLRSISVGYNFSTYEDELPKRHTDICALYNACLKTHNFGDIQNIEPSSLPDMDFFTYSFPCKNISIAGIPTGSNTGFDKSTQSQSALLWQCKKIIQEKRPKYLMMENVKNILGKENIGTLKEWISFLESLGYKNKYDVYNALDFGVPQNRERVIMMSELM